MSWYRWHQASFAICLLSPFPCLSSSSSCKPICSTFAIITCLPSLWHIRGRRQAPFTPLSLLLLTPLSSRPYFRAHLATEFSKGSRWHLALLSSRSQDGRQRSAVKRTKKAPKTRIYSFPHPAWSLLCFLCPQACCWFVVVVVVVVDFHASPSSGSLLQFEQKG